MKYIHNNKKNYLGRKYKAGGIFNAFQQMAPILGQVAGGLQGSDTAMANNPTANKVNQRDQIADSVLTSIPATAPFAHAAQVLRKPVGKLIGQDKNCVTDPTTGEQICEASKIGNFTSLGDMSKRAMSSFKGLTSGDFSADNIAGALTAGILGGGAAQNRAFEEAKARRAQHQKSKMLEGDPMQMLQRQRMLQQDAQTGFGSDFMYAKKGGKVKDYIGEAKAGGSNVGKVRKTSGATEGPFVGPSGGAPKGSYPVTNKKQWAAAKSYARHAPNPSGIKKAADRIGKKKGWLQKGGDAPQIRSNISEGVSLIQKDQNQNKYIDPFSPQTALQNLINVVDRSQEYNPETANINYELRETSPLYRNLTDEAVKVQEGLATGKLVKSGDGQYIATGKTTPIGGEFVAEATGFAPAVRATVLGTQAALEGDLQKGKEALINAAFAAPWGKIAKTVPGLNKVIGRRQVTTPAKFENVVNPQRFVRQKGTNIIENAAGDMEYLTNVPGSNISAMRLADDTVVNKVLQRVNKNIPATITKQTRPAVTRNVGGYNPGKFLGNVLTPTTTGARIGEGVLAKKKYGSSVNYLQEGGEVSNDLSRLRALLEANKSKNFVQRIIDPSKYPSYDFGEGVTGTHRMGWASGGEKGNERYYVYPNIIQRTEGAELENLEDDKWTAFDHAMTTGEYLEFNSPEEAEWFTKNYKKYWDSIGVKHRLGGIIKFGKGGSHAKKFGRGIDKSALVYNTQEAGIRTMCKDFSSGKKKPIFGSSAICKGHKKVHGK